MRKEYLRVDLVADLDQRARVAAEQRQRKPHLGVRGRSDVQHRIDRRHITEIQGGAQRRAAAVLAYIDNP